MNRRLFVLGGLLGGWEALHAQAAGPTEDQVKAVFLFNFTHFVDWPSVTFASATEPFVIGLVGAPDIEPLLQEAVANETVAGHPLRVQALQASDEDLPCQLLFVGRAAAARLPQVIARVARRRGVLTVSDVPDSASRGVMIELARENNRVRLRINLAEAQAAGLTIRSSLLRPADIVRTERR